jgi:hypothetical protein
LLAGLAVVLCEAAVAALVAFLQAQLLLVLQRHTQLPLALAALVVRVVQGLLILVHQVQALFLASIQPLVAVAVGKTQQTAQVVGRAVAQDF